MENNLEYRLVFCPTMEVNDTLYLCKDNKIHSRLKVFGNNKEIISGFEDKFTLFITYLINSFVRNEFTMSKEVLKKSNDSNYYKSIWKDILTDFLNCNSVKELDEYFFYYFRRKFNLDYKGLEILPFYSKKIKKDNVFDYLGDCGKLNRACEDKCSYNAIRAFLELFKINQIGLEFLFDDRYYFIVDDKLEINDKKFINKYKDKSNYKTKNLW